MGDEDLTLENVFICGGEPGYEDGFDFDDVSKDWTHDDVRAFFDQMSDHVGEWQGIPVPLDDDLPLRLHATHPLREVFHQTRVEIIEGGPVDEIDDTLEDPAEIIAYAMNRDERIVNRWYDGRHNRDVLIYKRGNGTAFAVTIPRAPNNSMDRLDLWINTMRATDAWDVDAEVKAMEKLGGLLTPRQRRCYLLTGSFLETSKRTGLVYVFRRLRPTIVLSSRHKWWSKLAETDSMRCIAVLCMHPIGYYDKTWAGCMVPSDDVIAHLLSMRADESYFWRKANQHDPASPEAGL